MAGTHSVLRLLNNRSIGALFQGTMRCVPLKSHEQLALQATHRVRQRFIVERTAIVNQMRVLLLEYGLTVPVSSNAPCRRSLKMPRMACLTLSAFW